MLLMGVYGGLDSEGAFIIRSKTNMCFHLSVCVSTLFISEHAPGNALWLELHQFWTSQHLYNKSPAYSYRCYITLQKFTDAKLRVETQHVAGRGQLIFCTGRWGCGT